ncbi:ubiquitin-like protein transferase protein [Trichomonas vaginalis G3]|uniref:ubiquitin-like protein transferase protein n=1 Tax=Trichomonas vaginalis (strain ATCC PRA-98 / G3) TaxID=412133 RepID=UPI0021E62704|nr:ubiquitin-like protein transferase protein [Trichomonas vaginalis G3]KAI5538519.1 ubiquitin-like protein transferase protein [Trichomonas vaginalis G3]
MKKKAPKSLAHAKFVYKVSTDGSDPECNYNKIKKQIQESVFNKNAIFSVISCESNEYVCPICQFKPAAARITLCGHIFCADCLAMHFEHSKVPSCPVCGEEITPSNVFRADVQYFTRNDKLIFQKISRSIYSCCHLAEKTSEPIDSVPFASSKSSLYSKFSIADKNYVENIIKKELKELDAQKEIYSKPQYYDENKLSYIIQIIEEVSHEHIPNTETPIVQLDHSDTFYQFYQEDHGLLVFLDVFSTDSLEAEYGSLKDAPYTIEAMPIRKYSTVVNDTFRRMTKSLNYLQRKTNIELVIADLSEYVSSQILSNYAIAADGSCPNSETSTSMHSMDLPYKEIPKSVSGTFNDDEFPDLFPVLKKKKNTQTPKSTSWLNLKL